VANKLPRRARRPDRGGPGNGDPDGDRHDRDRHDGGTCAPGLEHQATGHGHALPRRGLNPAVDSANKLVDAAELNPGSLRGLTDAVAADPVLASSVLGLLAAAIVNVRAGRVR
jgi:hypothetical protein